MVGYILNLWVFWTNIKHITFLSNNNNNITTQSRMLCNILVSLFWYCHLPGVTCVVHRCLFTYLYSPVCVHLCIFIPLCCVVDLGGECGRASTASSDRGRVSSRRRRCKLSSGFLQHLHQCCVQSVAPVLCPVICTSAVSSQLHQCCVQSFVLFTS